MISLREFARNIIKEFPVPAAERFYIKHVTTDGEVLYDGEVTAPGTWSETAVRIVALKYLYKGVDYQETSVYEMVQRVAEWVSSKAVQGGYISQEDEVVYSGALFALLLNQVFAFNSPVWFNVGLPTEKQEITEGYWHWDADKKESVGVTDLRVHPQTSACFIQPIEDSMEDIMRAAATEARIFKYGSGVGTDVSRIRSNRLDLLSSGGTPSGPLSFMRVLDEVAGVVRSGGKNRRAALYRAMRVEHPDILEFIDCKLREEDKARVLMEAGYTYEEAYSTVQYQNANHSVNLNTDLLGDNAPKRIELLPINEVNTGEELSVDTQELLHKMAQCAWDCGDPGLQFRDIMNQDRLTQEPIRSTNPCGEFAFIDDSSCNLASLNLLKFLDAGDFNWELYQRVAALVFISQDVLINYSSYPSKEILENSLAYRPIGLGYTNLGALLIHFKAAYSGLRSVDLTKKVTAALTSAAYNASRWIESKLKSPLQGAKRLPKDTLWFQRLQGFLEQAPIGEIWDLPDEGTRTLRNGLLTLLAPTGTISFMMDCTTTGIEPLLSLQAVKTCSDGSTIVMEPPWISKLVKERYGEEAARILHETGSLCNAIPDSDQCIFLTALPDTVTGECLAPVDHLEILIAAQQFLTGAVSKTINMPADSTPDDILNVWRFAAKSGVVKGVTVYRDGSKSGQPLSTKKKEVPEASPKVQESESAAEVVRICGKEPLPDTREAVTHKFNVGNHTCYITVGLYEDGRPGELFITMSKEGSTLGGFVDAFGILVSTMLQHGIPLTEISEKFHYTRFAPSGYTGNPEIPYAHSVLDYIFKWLHSRFAPSKMPAQDLIEEESVVSLTTVAGTGIHCERCGAEMTPAGSCMYCPACGESSGCS